MMPQPPPPTMLSPGQSNMQNLQSINNLSNQMQDIRLVPPSPQTQGTNSLFNSAKTLPDTNQNSPQHKFPNATTVTYSNQMNATYPYVNNNNQVGIPRPPLNNQYHTASPVAKLNPNENIPGSNLTTYSNGVTNGNDIPKPNQENGMRSPQHQTAPQPPGRFSGPPTNAAMRPQGSPFPPQTSGPLSSSNIAPRPPNPPYASSPSPNMPPRPQFSPMPPKRQLTPGMPMPVAQGPSGSPLYGGPNMTSPSRPSISNVPPTTGPPNSPYPNSSMPLPPSGLKNSPYPNPNMPPSSGSSNSVMPPGPVPRPHLPPQPGFQQFGSQPTPGSYPASPMPPGGMPPASQPHYQGAPGSPGTQPPYQGVPGGPGFQPSYQGVPSGPGSQPPYQGIPGSPGSQPPYQGVPGGPGSQPLYQGVPGFQPHYQGPGSSGGNSYPYGSPSPAQSKLSIDQMPSNVAVREDDKKFYAGRPYVTDVNVKGEVPPLVSTNFITQDRGMCSPRFIRSSLYCLPNNPDILKQTALPFAITINPLASVAEGENEPPTCIYREEGPLRCKRCKAYICPFMTFMEGGRCFQCAFCKVVTEVPQDYFCFLDGMGERTDKYHRPELCLGSYEYIATKDYCRNEELPNPPAYIFMIEVSHATFRNGLIPLLCENMKSVLQCLMNDESKENSKLRVGFVTYNNVLHFYNMKKNLTQPHVMVLSDVHNAFVPLLDGFLVTLAEAEALVDSLMEHIPRLFMNEPATEIILGPVIQVGLEALKNANCSGKLLVFHSTIPNADAPGKLPHREGQKMLGTDKQKIALSPQTDFYSKLAQDCVAAGCAVDLYLFPNAYVDVASLGPLIRHTGGQMYKYTYFQSQVDGDRFLEDLEKNLTTPTAFDAVLRVRTSAGISPVFYYGNFYMSNSTDVELSCIDGHKAVTVEFAYDDKIPENETVFIQAALLYTTCNGDRRIRVHNLALPTAVGMPDIYKCAELDTILNFLAKHALKQLYDHSPQQITNALVSRSVKILTCYRKNCVLSGSGAGQLILPETLKLLPIYSNCLLRSDAIGGGADMALDDRSFAMLCVNSMSVKSTSIYFYPTLIPLHEIDLESSTMPTPIRCSIEKMTDTGAYLLENGIYMFLWIGQAISPEWLENVFGVQSTNQIEKQKSSLPELENPLSKKIRDYIELLEEERQWCMKLSIMVQGDKLEIVFRQFLVEDKGAHNSLSSTDFMVLLHNEITKNT